jgi:hypothetical protein
VGLTIAVGAPGGIHRLRGVVAVYSALRAGSAFQPVAVEKSTIAEQRADSPATDRLAGIGDGLIDLLLTFLHAQADFELLLQRQVLEAEGFAGSDADTGELRAYLLLVLLGGSKLQREVEVVEKVGLCEFLIDFRKIDRCCRYSFSSLFILTASSQINAPETRCYNQR